MGDQAKTIAFHHFSLILTIGYHTALPYLKDYPTTLTCTLHSRDTRKNPTTTKMEYQMPSLHHRTFTAAVRILQTSTNLKQAGVRKVISCKEEENNKTETLSRVWVKLVS